MIFKTGKCLIAIAINFMVATVSYSLDFTSCKVVEIVATGINNAHDAVDCTISPRPACATGSTWFGFDKSTEEGKMYMSIVLTAFALGTNVTGNIDDTQCSPYQGNVGLLRHIRMTN